MTLDRMNNPVNQNNRAEKINKARQKKELEEKIAVLEKRDDIDEDVSRKCQIWTTFNFYFESTFFNYESTY